MSLIRIGESLHCHLPAVQKSARRWLCGDALDRLAGERHLLQVLRDQVEAGADYLDVNVDNFFTEEGIGRQGALSILGHILEMIVHQGKGIPPCIDSSDPSVLEWGLQRYQELTRGKGRSPLVNSVTISRQEILRLRSGFPFSVVGMLLEQAGEQTGFTEIAGPEVYHQTARVLFDQARGAGFAPQEVFFDPTVGPLGADMVGYTRRTFEGIRGIRTDPEMAGVHICLGLSNCSDGLPRRLAINRAYLRVAMEYGVDAAIVDVMQVTGEDLVEGRILKLIRQVVEGEVTDTLELLVDFAQAHPRPHPRPAREVMPNLFQEALADRSRPVYILEMAPAEGNLDEIFSLAEAARQTPFTFSVTDTPGGNRVPGPDTIALEVGRIMNRQPIVNLSCKSDDRNGLIQRVLGLYRQGLRNLFAVTGDYSFSGRASFDLDAVTLLLALDTLRRGLDFPDFLPRSGGALEGLTAGASVSPFKYLEPDLWGQYLKMWKKRQVGADYFITQVGVDVAKFQELRLFMDRAGMGEVPLLGSVYFFTPQVVRSMARAHVAGVVIPEDLKSRYQGKLAPKKERARLKGMNFVELAEYHRRLSIRRAALLGDILVRGLGYRGVDLAGISEMDIALEILETIQQLQARDWQDSYAEYREGDGEQELHLGLEGGFYLFPKGENELLVDGPFQGDDRRRYNRTSRGMKWMHGMFFSEGEGLYGLLKWAVSGPQDSLMLRFMTQVEQAVKTPALGCEMCGDCRIPDLQYLCPEPTRGCAKRLTNGPCGGADERGMCEVHPERRCYWGQVIEAALGAEGLEPLSRIQLPKDPRLSHTSSWRNEAVGLCPRPVDLGTLATAALPVVRKG